MDKATPPDHRKPAKQAELPDMPGRGSTYASRLVAGAGVSGSVSTPSPGLTNWNPAKRHTWSKGSMTARRIALTVEHRSPGSAQGWAVFCDLLKGVSGA